MKESIYKELKEFINSHCDYYSLNDCCEECEYWEYRDCKSELVNDNFKIYKIML